jgi:hypothetical protein
MVKRILVLAVCLLGLMAGAQVAQKDIQGEWQLVSCSDGIAVINVLKGTFELDADYKSGLSAEELKEEEHDYAILVAQYAKSWVEFKGDTMTGDLVSDTLGEEVAEVTYTLSEFDDLDASLDMQTADGGEISMPISLQGKKLYIVNAEYGISLVYQKM